MPEPDFLIRLSALLERYLREDNVPGQHLAVLRWQIGEGHALENRDTYPGHVTTSALIVSPDLTQTLLIDHRMLRRWLQPGGHYEPADLFWHSARREAVEETAVADLALHPWHGGEDRPFLIDSHEVPGKASRGEKAHLHHDLQFLFVADPALPLTAQIEEVAAARWHPIGMLAEVSPGAWRRIQML
ncbi:MAG: NUDIX domain-containing protein [Proteobacteria bacterium]|nr:NUDIX domain-containing protein [Pseudomonadota bacterium]